MDIPYDLDCIISIDELETPLEKYIGKACQCCGCVNRSNRIWKNDLVVSGPSDDGYYQIADLKRELREGCSGGIIIDTEKSTLLGIHKGRIVDKYDTKREKDVFALIIPGVIIKKEIEKWEEASNE